MEKCSACEKDLDQWGRCAYCFCITKEDIEARKWITVYWTVCSIHGAVEVTGRGYRREWKESNPKDRRRKIMRHEWAYACEKCEPLSYANVTWFKESIERRREHLEPELSERLRQWEEMKRKPISVHVESTPT